MANPKYLLKRPGSKNWRCRLQYPEGMGAGPTREFSLRTDNVIVAQQRAAPYIHEYLNNLVAYLYKTGKVAGTCTLEWQIEPGKFKDFGQYRAFAKADGSTIQVTDMKNGECFHELPNKSIAPTDSLTKSNFVA